MEAQHAVALSSLIGDATRVLAQSQVVEQLSRDCYWYSPVLRRQLDGKAGEIVVQAVTVREIQDVLRYCYAHDLPVTVRLPPIGHQMTHSGLHCLVPESNFHMRVFPVSPKIRTAY